MVFRGKTVVFRSVVLWLALFILSGCGGPSPELAPVEGQITLDDEPLAYASVSFYSEAGGRGAGGMTDARGFYRLHFNPQRLGAIPGMSRVRIVTEGEAGQHEDGSYYPASGEILSERYTSGLALTFEVKAGRLNVADFHLTSAPDVDAPVSDGDYIIDELQTVTDDTSRKTEALDASKSQK